MRTYIFYIGRDNRVLELDCYSPFAALKYLNDSAVYLGEL